jgi:hypothetical protein
MARLVRNKPVAFGGGELRPGRDRKLFLKKAVDSFNEFDRLSAASTKKPLKHAV